MDETHPDYVMALDVVGFSCLMCLQGRMEMWATGETSLSVSRISWKRTMSTGTLDQVVILFWTLKAT